MWWLVQYCVYLIFWYLFKTANGLLYIFYFVPNYFGKNRTIGNLARRYKCITTNKSNPVSIAWETDFLGVLTGFKEVEQVLHSQLVSLYCISLTKAVFVESRVVGEVYRTDVDPFFYNAQLKRVNNIYVVDLDVLDKVVKQQALPEIPTVLVTSTGRCGSTLLSQILEIIPESLCIAEPDALTNLALLESREKLDYKRCEQLACLIMDVLLIQSAKLQPSLITIKTRSVATQFIEHIHRTRPQVKHLFLYRDGLKSVQSMERSFMSLAPMEFWWKMLLVTEMPLRLLATPLSRYMHFPAMFSVLPRKQPEKLLKMTNEKHVRSLPLVALWTLNWAVPCADFKHAKSLGIPVLAIKYEELVQQTDEVCSRLVDFLKTEGVEKQEFIAKSKLVTQMDSQGGSEISQKKLENRSKIELNEAEQVFCDAICDTLDVPRLHLENISL